MAAQNHRRSWLCPTDADYERLVESFHETSATRMVLAVVVAASFLALVPAHGWTPVLFGIIGAAELKLLDWRMPRLRRPEWAIAFSTLSTTVIVSMIVAVSGGPASGALPIYALATITFATRFRREVVYTGLVIQICLMAVATAVGDLDALLADPMPVACMVTLLVGAAMFTVAFCDTEDVLRNQALRDPLTGLLNRAGLATGFQQLISHATSHDMPIAVAVYDLDRFKRVNDIHGHDVGDEVLRQTAHVISRDLRPSDLVGRYGGEEFVVVMPGLTLDQARAIAERQRTSLAAARPAGLDVTLSGGIAATTADEADWDGLFRRADLALLVAKGTGRNRVLREDDPQLTNSPSRPQQAVVHPLPIAQAANA